MLYIPDFSAALRARALPVASPSSAPPKLSLIILVADGARPDTLRSAIDAGDLPALARLRAEGGLHTVTSVFPSVTGPAYAPFLMGRFPGPVGLPGLRWYDRTRTRSTFPDHTRSYVGAEMRHIDADLDPAAPTLFELASPALAALNMIGRGLPRANRMGRDIRFVLRAAQTHFRGWVPGWLQIDREMGLEVARRIRTERPKFTFAALTGIDKTSHAAGHESPLVREGMQIVDQVAARIRDDAEQDGRWDDTHLWVVSDHGHSPVRSHENLAGVVRDMGLRPLAHPWTYRTGCDSAVMVSGNAMAHIYLEISRRTRPGWPELRDRWETLAAALLERPSIDLLVLPHAPGSCEIRAHRRGMAMLTTAGRTISYRPVTGDPLGTGEVDSLDFDDAWHATIDTDYPDSLVQIALLASSPRSGELILSASRDWDFRDRYEPIPHVSSHGALHREHMLVPLLVNRPVARTPLRTVDVMPSALTALGLPVPGGLDGSSFL